VSEAVFNPTGDSTGPRAHEGALVPLWLYTLRVKEAELTMTTRNDAARPAQALRPAHHTPELNPASPNSQGR
jgi:hypothetical protein